MANRITFDVMVNPAGFVAGMRTITAEAAAASARLDAINGKLTSGHGSLSGASFGGAIRELFVLLREGLRGNWNRMIGSLTLLASYTGTLGKFFHSTAQNALEYAAAQNKLAEQLGRTAQAAQALYTGQVRDLEATGLNALGVENLTKAEKQEALSATAAYVAQRQKATMATDAAKAEAEAGTLTVTALGWVAIAAVVTGVALLVLWRHLTNAAKAQRDYAESVDATRRTVADEAKALDDGRRANAELQRWLEKELSTRKELRDVMQQRLDDLKAETEATVGLMRARGASASEINAYEIQELQMQKQILEATLAQAQAEQTKAEATLAGARQAQRVFEGRGEEINGTSYTLKGATDARDKAAAALDQINESLKDNWIIKGLKEGATQSGGMGAQIGPWLGTAYQYQQFAEAAGVERTDTFASAISKISAGIPVDVTEGTKKFTTTLGQVTDDLNKNQTIVNRLSDRQDELNDTLSNAKDDLTTATGDIRQMGDALHRVNTELGIRQGVGAQTAALEDAKRRREGISGSGLVSTGNFLGLSRGAIENLQAKMLTVQQKMAMHLENIDSKMIGTGGGLPPSF